MWKVIWKRKAVLAPQEQENKLRSSKMRRLSDGVHKQEAVQAAQRTEKDLQEANIDLQQLQEMVQFSKSSEQPCEQRGTL